MTKITKTLAQDWEDLDASAKEYGALKRRRTPWLRYLLTVLLQMELRIQNGEWQICKSKISNRKSKMRGESR